MPEDPGSITPGSKYTGPTWVADADYPWVAAQVELKEYVDDAFADVDGRFGELEERVRELERIVLDFVEPEDAAQEELPVGVAARRGIRQRSITDVPQNEAGEENQDSGEMEPS